VRDADQIVVLDHGRVAEIGRHEELLARGGRYALLVSRDAELATVFDEPPARRIAGSR
jgi:ATP-binding cassette subfamily B protein